MKTDLFQSCGHCWVFQICWHIECSTFTASTFRIWNSSTGIPSPPLALFVVMLFKAHLTSHSRMSGSRSVITPLWLSGLWRSFLYSSVYSCHDMHRTREIPAHRREDRLQLRWCRYWNYWTKTLWSAELCPLRPSPPVLLLRTGYVMWQKYFANVRPSTRFPSWPETWALQIPETAALPALAPHQRQLFG